MKKIFTLILSIFSIAGFTQSLQLSWHNGPLGAHDSIMIAGDAFSEIMDTVLVTNISNSSIDVKLTKTELHTFNGGINYFCWYSCYSNTVFTSPDPLTLSAGQTRDNFTTHMMANGTFGTTIIRYKFFNVANTNDTASVVVVIISGATGLHEITNAHAEMSNAYPNPAKSQTSFDFVIPQSYTGNATLEIHNLLGSKVREIPVQGHNGKLNVQLDGLQKGVYFCNFVLNDETKITRKLVIE